MPGPSFELKHKTIRAGAGAGKTTGLIQHVLDVYEGFKATHEREPRMILTTFTVKATHELRERLIDKACAIGSPALLEFVSNPSRLHISTLHGVFSLFLNQVGHLYELDSGARVAAESEAKSWSRHVLRECLVQNPDFYKWMEEFGFERLLAVCRAYSSRLRIDENLRPANLQDLLAEERQMAALWSERLEGVLLDLDGKVSNPAWLEYLSSIRVFSSSLKGRDFDWRNFPKRPRKHPKDVELRALHESLDDLYTEFDDLVDSPGWDRAVWPQMVKAWSEIESLLIQFSKDFQQYKRDHSLMQIEDLELGSLEIIRQAPHLADLFSENWDYWMIDEYQDTSPVQVEILKALVKDRFSYRVGDPQQSIYLFRGSEVKVFRDAEEATERLGGVIETQRINYRSRPELLSWINQFMSSVHFDFEDMVAASGREHRLSSSEHPAVLYRAVDSESESKAVVQRVGELIASGAELEQICILSRTHRTLLELNQKLRALGYPTQLHSSRGFASRREILDARALWKFLVHPHDNHELLCLLRSPWFRVEDSTLMQWMSNRPKSLWTWLINQKTENHTIERLKKLRLEAQGERGLLLTFEKALVDCGAIDMSLKVDSSGRMESNLWKLIMRARELEKQGGLALLDFFGEDDPRESEEQAEGDAVSAQVPNSIQLMTVHGSKGLEFDHVLIPAMGERPMFSKISPIHFDGGLFSLPIKFEDESSWVASPLELRVVREMKMSETAELDRWLYVAVTRARHSVSLFASQVASKSWASRSDLFELPEGVHDVGGVSYWVRAEWPEPVRYQEPASTSVALREPWADVSLVEQHHSVTDLIDKKSARFKKGLSDLLDERRFQGVRVHRFLQLMKYRLGNSQTGVQVDGLSPDSNSFAAKFFKEDFSRLFPEKSPDLREVFDFVVSLKEPPLLQFIRDGFVEWGFQVNSPVGVIEGQIDLWGVYDERVYLVDYKTGSSKSEEKAQKQLELYAWALRKYGCTQPIDGYLIYLSEKRVISFECQGEFPLT